MVQAAIRIVRQELENNNWILLFSLFIISILAVYLMSFIVEDEYRDTFHLVQAYLSIPIFIFGIIY